MKIVINSCFGGFGLSHKACMLYARLSGFKLYAYRKDPKDISKYVPLKGKNKHDFLPIFYFKKPLTKFNNKNWWYDRDIDRADPILVRVVEKLGEKANNSCASLKIVEIPDGVDWEIHEYDGSETIHEKHRSWN